MQISYLSSFELEMLVLIIIISFHLPLQILGTWCLSVLAEVHWFCSLFTQCIYCGVNSWWLCQNKTCSFFLHLFIHWSLSNLSAIFPDLQHSLLHYCNKQKINFIPLMAFSEYVPGPTSIFIIYVIFVRKENYKTLSRIVLLVILHDIDSKKKCVV